MRLRDISDKHDFRALFNTLNLRLKCHGPRGRMSAKKMVEEGYDRISDRYAKWTNRTFKAHRTGCVKSLLASFPENADLLDLGCGTGLPSTKMLAQHFKVTGVDVSAANISRARLNVANARFLKADMVELTLDPDRYDVVTAFYSLFHLPRSEQPVLLGKIMSWLRDGGVMVATLAANAMNAHIEQDWLGAPMYWSSFDSETNLKLFEAAGFKILTAVKKKEYAFGRWNTFQWVVAQKPEKTPNSYRLENTALARFFDEPERGRPE